MTNYALGTPALNGETVLQGHADYCAAHGHGYNIKDGVERGWCPRCGEDNGLLLSDAVEIMEHAASYRRFVGSTVQGDIVWPSVDVDMVDGSEDDSDVIAHTGDLAATLDEARGWMRDCGVIFVRDTRRVLDYVAAKYDHGLEGFALDTLYL